jgi:hypothetical protein
VIARPGLYVSMAIFALSNTFAMYQIAANTAFVERLPNERRAQAFGLVNAGLVVGQGVAFAIAGAAAEVVPPSTVVALTFRLRSSAPMAANVACRRASHCETSWPRGLAYQACTYPCGSFSLGDNVMMLGLAIGSRCRA